MENVLYYCLIRYIFWGAAALRLLHITGKQAAAVVRLPWTFKKDTCYAATAAEMFLTAYGKL